MKIACQLIFITLLFLSGCTKYLDKTYKSTKLTTREFEFAVLNDKNIFTYTSSVNQRRDEEIILTTKFKVCLPKRIQTFRIENMSHFIFYYSDHQYLLISMDNEKKEMVGNDTLYIPQSREITTFLEYNFADSVKAKSRIAGRKSYFFKRQHATILLYNIKNEAIEQFLESARTLEFL